jgi:hypothetical protein
MLSDLQIERYSRQILLPQVGGRGQQSIFAARVEVVGDGLVARTAARYLCAAGVGHLVVSRAADSSAEPRHLELDNPDCQVTFDTPEPDVMPNLILHAGTGPGRDSIDHRCARRLIGTACNGHAAVTDLGRTCARCAVAAAAGGTPLTGNRTSGPLDEVAEFVTGALLAQEALALLLAPERPGGRSIAIGVADATAQSPPSTPLPSCPHAAAAGGG